MIKVVAKKPQRSASQIHIEFFFITFLQSLLFCEILCNFTSLGLEQIIKIKPSEKFTGEISLFIRAYNFKNYNISHSTVVELK